VLDVGIANYIHNQLYPAFTPIPPTLNQKLAELETENAKAGDIMEKFIEARKQAQQEKKTNAQDEEKHRNKSQLVNASKKS